MLDLMTKDAKLAHDLADDTGTAMPLLDSVVRRFEQAQNGTGPRGLLRRRKALRTGDRTRFQGQGLTRPREGTRVYSFTAPVIDET